MRGARQDVGVELVGPVPVPTCLPTTPWTLFLFGLFFTFQPFLASEGLALYVLILLFFVIFVSLSHAGYTYIFTMLHFSMFHYVSFFSSSVKLDSPMHCKSLATRTPDVVCVM